MKTAYIVEPDQKVANDIATSIFAIDPKLNILKASSLQEFSAWVKQQASKPVELRKTDPVLLSLIILEADFYVGKNLVQFQADLGVLKKENLVVTGEMPTIVLSAFEPPDHSFHKFETKEISNIIVKPFDKPILDQHLRIAISGNVQVKETTVFKQQLKSKIEMIKDVTLTAIHEIGFDTVSNRKIEVGKTTKYYSHWFKDGPLESVFARCTDCTPDPKDPNKFLVKFNYFGLTSGQVQNLRRSLYKTPSHHGLPKSKEPIKSGKIGVIVLNASSAHDNEVKDSISGKFSNLEIQTFSQLDELISTADKHLVKNSLDAEKSLFKKLNPLKIYFSKTGNILGFEMEKDPTEHFLGFTDENEIKGNGFLQSLVHFEDKTVLSEVLSGKLPSLSGKPNLAFFRSKIGTLIGLEFHAINSIVHKTLGAVFEVQAKELSSLEAEIHLLKKQSLSSPVAFLFVNSAFLKEDDLEIWKSILNGFKNQNAKFGFGAPLLFISSSNNPNEEYYKKVSSVVTDFILHPFERVYLLKRMKAYCPHLLEKDEALENHVVEHSEIISVGNEVDLTSVSEAGLTMKYYRGITFGSFRRFRVKSTVDSEDKVYIARCFFAEDDKKGSFDSHFVFFGVTDTYLKNIRKWIKENYILTKQGSD